MPLLVERSTRDMNGWMLLITTVIAGGAAAAGSMSGKWEGTLGVPGQPLKVVFHLTEGAAGKLTGTMDSPSQGATGIALARSTVNEKRVRIEVPSIKASYSGVLSGDGSSVTGQWKQGAGTPLKLQRSGGSGAAPEGDWQGSISAGGQALRLVFHLKKSSGKWSGTMDSPDQRVNGLPISLASVSGKNVRIEVPKAAGTFTGSLAGTTLTGEWWQGVTLPLTLKKSR